MKIKDIKRALPEKQYDKHNGTDADECSGCIAKGFNSAPKAEEIKRKS